MYKLIAHRGEKKSSKENSLAAFLDAINSDYYGFECDVRMTKDDDFVIYHDPLFKGKLIKNYTMKELRKHGFINLDEVLQIKTNKMILIDIKDAFIDTDKLHKKLKLYSNKDIYIMSFYDSVIRKLFCKERWYKVGILNYILNSDEKHFEYDFLAILNAVINDKIINVYKLQNKKLFIYGVKKEMVSDLYPYYIVD